MKTDNSKTNLTHSIKLLLATSILWALLPSCSALALHRQSFPVPGDYGLEYSNSNGQIQYLDVTAARGEVLILSLFKRIKNWQRPPEQPRTPSEIQLKCRREGDAIKIELSLLFTATSESSGSSVTFRTPPNEGFRGQLIGVYFARLGESMHLKELADYGIEPFSLKVVSAKAQPADHNDVGNRTKAIEVVKVDKSRDIYRFTLKNLSSKKILICHVDGPNGKRILLGGQKPYLASGEVKDFKIYLSDYVKDPQTYVPNGQMFVIAHVLFEDFTYEGNKELAIEWAAWKMGMNIQRSRVAKLLRMAADTFEQDSRKAMANLRQQLSELSVIPEDHEIEELARHFLPLSESERTWLIMRLRISLHQPRDSLLETVSHPEKYPEVREGTVSRNWLQKMAEAYEKDPYQ